MFAARKQWPLTGVAVELQFNPQGKLAAGGTDISRRITLQGVLSAEQRERLLQAAHACPMHEVLTGEVQIATTSRSTPPPPPCSLRRNTTTLSLALHLRKDGLRPSNRYSVISLGCWDGQECRSAQEILIELAVQRQQDRRAALQRPKPIQGSPQGRRPGGLRGSPATGVG